MYRIERIIREVRYPDTALASREWNEAKNHAEEVITALFRDEFQEFETVRFKIGSVSRGCELFLMNRHSYYNVILSYGEAMRTRGIYATATPLAIQPGHDKDHDIEKIEERVRKVMSIED